MLNRIRDAEPAVASEQAVAVRRPHPATGEPSTSSLATARHADACVGMVDAGLERVVDDVTQNRARSKSFGV